MDGPAADITPPDISRLVAIMARLRDRETGCPWDIEQDFASIAPYTIEEAYEVADAIERDDMSALKDELGDLLLQVVFHSRMAEEAGAFALSDVITAICDKMVRRHPHVFGPDGNGVAEASPGWEQIKAHERAEKAGDDASALAGVALGLPSLNRAEKLQKRAARVGFDWDNVSDVLDKIMEELDELSEAQSAEHVAEEVGDLLFAVANLARHHQVDPESALRAANLKFERRFRAMEAMAGPVPFPDLSLDQQEALWQAVKVSEKS